MFNGPTDDGIGRDHGVFQRLKDVSHTGRFSVIGGRAAKVAQSRSAYLGRTCRHRECSWPLAEMNNDNRGAQVSFLFFRADLFSVPDGDARRAQRLQWDPENPREREREKQEGPLKVNEWAGSHQEEVSDTNDDKWRWILPLLSRLSAATATAVAATAAATAAAISGLSDYIIQADLLLNRVKATKR